MHHVNELKNSKKPLFKNLTRWYLVIQVLTLITTFELVSATEVIIGSETISLTASVAGSSVGPSTPPAPNPISNNGVPLLAVETGVDEVIFSGIAYKGSTVRILKNGLILNELSTHEDGTFEIPVTNIKPGTYTFGIQAKDPSQLVSSVISKTVYVASGVTTEIGDLAMSPTVTTDKTEVIKNGQILFSGMAIASSSLMITIFANNGIIKNFQAQGNGTWSYVFDTAGLDFGTYTAKVRSKSGTILTQFSEPISFTVGTSNTKRVRTHGVAFNRCDLNNDSRVNLLDFSIMAFWYKRTGFPRKVDLNSDLRVNLTDLSILAYCWTG
jgi:hypothetical protein